MSADGAQYRSYVLRAIEVAVADDARAGIRLTHTIERFERVMAGEEFMKYGVEWDQQMQTLAESTHLANYRLKRRTRPFGAATMRRIVR